MADRNRREPRHLFIVSGLYLWFPKGTPFLQAFRISGATRRLVWRDVHKVTGVVLAPVLALQLIAGLAWTEVWGGEFVQAWSTLAATNAAPGQSASHHETLNAGSTKVVPWNLEQTPLPSSSHAGHGSITLDAAIEAAQRAGIGQRFFVGVPRRCQMACGPSRRPGSTMTSTIRHRNSRCTWIGIRAVWWVMAAGTSTARWPERWPRGPASYGFARVVEPCRRKFVVPVGGRAEPQWSRHVVAASAVASVATRGAAAASRSARPAVTWLTAVTLGVLFPLAGATLVAIVVLDWALVRRLPALRQLLN